MRQNFQLSNMLSAALIPAGLCLILGMSITDVVLFTMAFISGYVAAKIT